MSDVVQTLKIVVSGDIKQALKGLNKIGSDVQRLSRNVTRTGRSLTRNFTMPLVAAGAAAIAAGVRVGNLADELLDQREQTGLSTDALQEYRRVATAAGVDQNVVARATEQLTMRMSRGAEGSADMRRALDELGISAKDAEGNIRPMDQVVNEAITRLSSMEDVTKRNVLATQLFSRGARDLAPVLGLGADEIERLRAEAHELGLVFGEDALEQANRFRVEWQTLRDQFKAATTELGLGLIPILSDLASTIGDRLVPMVQSGARWVGQLDMKTVKLVAGVGAAVAAIGPLVLVGGKLIGVLGLILTPAGLVITALGSIAFTAGVVGSNWDVLRLKTELAWTAIKVAVLDGADAWFRAQEAMTHHIPILGRRVAESRAEFRAWADDVIAGSGQRIHELERRIAASGAGVKDFGKDLRDAVRDLVDFTSNAGGAGDAIGRIMDTLRRQVGLAEAMSFLELPGADEARAKLSAYETALRALLSEGLDPTDERVQELVLKIQELSEELASATDETERMTAMQREAGAIIQSLLTPAEAHEAHLARLQELLEAGKLDLVQYGQAVKQAHEAYEKAAPGGERMVELLREQARVLEEIQTPQEALAEREALLLELREEGLLTLEQYNRALDVARQRYEDLRDPMAELGSLAATTFNRGLNAVVAFASGARNAISQFVRQAMMDLARLMVRLAAVRALSGILTPGGFFATALSIPARAMGGPGRAMRPHLVGERGPELFVPPASGQFHSAQRTASMSAGPSGAELVAAIGPVPVTSPEVAALHDWYRRLITAALPDYRERGGRI